MLCEEHGPFCMAVNKLVNMSQSCSSCADCGYSQNKAGVLYFLENKVLNIIKIGISNNLHNRIATLSGATPFHFALRCFLSFTDGSIPPSLEHNAQKSLNKAGFRNFDGATEWYLNNKKTQNFMNNVINSYPENLNKD